MKLNVKGWCSVAFAHTNKAGIIAYFQQITPYNLIVEFIICEKEIDKEQQASTMEKQKCII